MDEGKAEGPKWWSRPQKVAPVPPEPRERPAPEAPGTPAGPAAAAPPHAQDPYDTPPYGEPRPLGARAARAAPRGRGHAAPSRAPAAQPPARAPAARRPPAPPPLSVGQWHRYDPWAPPGGTAAQPPARTTGSRRAPLAAALVAVTLIAGGIGGAMGAYVHDSGDIADVTLPQAPHKPGPGPRTASRASPPRSCPAS